MVVDPSQQNYFDGSHRENDRSYSSTIPTRPNLNEIFDRFQQNAREMNVSKIRESRKKLDVDLQKLQTRIAIL